MTNTVLDIPPALLSPYTEGDATYLASLGAQLDSYPQLIVDIEYGSLDPNTIVWAFDDPVYRAGAVALLVDWVQKFRAGGAGYTGNLGVYTCMPNFVEYARKTLIGSSQSEIDAEYNLAYQFAIDIAPLVAEADTLYPSFYLSSYGPFQSNEKSFDDRMTMFRIAADTTLEVFNALYPGKRLEPFINKVDLDARIGQLNISGYPAVNVWTSTNSPFYDQHIAVINNYADYGVSQITTDFRYHALNDWPDNPNATTEPSNYLVCQRSGFRVSVEEGLKRTWDGLFVRQEDWEPRHPQSFVRARAEKQRGSYSPEPEDIFVSNPVSSGTFGLEDGGVLLLESGDGLSFEV